MHACLHQLAMLLQSHPYICLAQFSSLQETSIEGVTGKVSRQGSQTGGQWGCVEWALSVQEQMWRNGERDV